MLLKNERTEAEASGDTVGAAVAALNEAVASIFAKFVDDLKGK